MGLDLHCSVPDGATHCRFRNARVKAGAYDGLLTEVCRQIEGHRLKMKEAGTAIIDATLIEVQLGHVHMLRLRRRIAPKINPE